MSMEKEYDCIADKRRVQAEIYEETKHMSHEERRAWAKERLERSPLRDWWAQIKTVEEARAEEARKRRA